MPTYADIEWTETEAFLDDMGHDENLAALQAVRPVTYWDRPTIDIREYPEPRQQPDGQEPTIAEYTLTLEETTPWYRNGLFDRATVRLFGDQLTLTGEIPRDLDWEQYVEER